MKLEQIQHSYFLGIGGIGMSAIARYFKSIGIRVSGYDLTATPLTKELEAEGMDIHYEDLPEQLPTDIDLVVRTPAVPADHLELNALKARQIPMMKRAEVLGFISLNRRTLAIAGTHGKTTTSAILTHLLHVGGLNCSAFLGGIAQNFKSNFVAGDSDWVVMEADEFDRSFHQLFPDLAVITAMDADHLDIYGTEQDMQLAYRQFAAQVKPGGTLLYAAGLPLEEVIETHPHLQAYSYGVERPADYRAFNLRVDEQGFMCFDLQTPEATYETLRFTLPGKHNIENTVAAIALCLQVGIPAHSLYKGLLSFSGVRRRFEFVLRNEKMVFIDDYAHHPEELKAAISAARMLYPNSQLTGIFQPHLFTRTRDFADGFAEALDLLDTALLLPIYPAREKPIAGVTTEMIFERMKMPNKRLVAKEELPYLLESVSFEVLLTLGAGDIDKLVPSIRQWLLANSQLSPLTL